MTDPQADPEVSLPEFLSSRARRASDARLALDAACGFVVAAVAALWRGPAWHLIASAAVCFLAYGAWGIADREMSERASTIRKNLGAFRVGRIVAAIVGALAAVTFIVGGLFVALGRIMS